MVEAEVVVVDTPEHPLPRPLLPVRLAAVMEAVSSAEVMDLVVTVLEDLDLAVSALAVI